MFSVKVDDKPLDDLKKKIDSGKTALGTLGETLASAAVVKGVSNFIQSQIDMGSEVNDAADRLGISAEELQKFQYASKLAGIDAGECSASLGFLNKNLGLAATGNATAAAAFASMGLATRNTDGSVRKMSDVALDLADHIASLESPAEQAAVAVGVLGRAGARMVPILRGGREELSKVFNEFGQLGGAMSGEFVTAADAAGDEVDRMKLAMTGLKSQIAINVLPTFTGLTSKFKETIVDGQKFNKQTYVAQEGLVALTGLGILGTARGLGDLAKQFKYTEKEGLAGFADGIGKMSKAMFKAGIPILAIYLALDELYTLFNGGETAIEPFIDGLAGLGTTREWVNEIKTGFFYLTAEIKDASAAWDDWTNKIAGKPKPLTAGGNISVQDATDLAGGILAQGGLSPTSKGTLKPVIRADDNLPPAGPPSSFAPDEALAAQRDHNIALARGAKPAGALIPATGGDIAAGILRGTAYGPPMPAPVGAASTSMDQRNDIKINVTVPAGTVDPQKVGSMTGTAVRDALAEERRAAFEALSRNQVPK